LICAVEVRTPLRAIAVTHDARFIATADDEKTAAVWDVRTGVEVARFTHDQQVVSLAFSPDGRKLLAGSMDGSAQVHLLPIDEVMRNARDRLPRTFSDEERSRLLSPSP
jgi:WD40 repeat protein